MEASERRCSLSSGNEDLHRRDQPVAGDEFATFFADVSKGAFQMYTLRWLGGNEDPDIFHTFDSQRFPPHGTNRGRYVNAELDTLIKQAGGSADQAQRRA